MAKLTSLDDLASLLSESDRAAVEANKIQVPKQGYSGKPQKLTVSLDSKRRRGKTVTLISGFQATPGELEEISGLLKKMCGAGGQVLDNAIEIQGVHRAKVIDWLKGKGYLVKG